MSITGNCTGVSQTKLSIMLGNGVNVVVLMKWLIKMGILHLWIRVRYRIAIFFFNSEWDSFILILFIVFLYHHVIVPFPELHFFCITNYSWIRYLYVCLVFNASEILKNYYNKMWLMHLKYDILGFQRVKRGARSLFTYGTNEYLWNKHQTINWLHWKPMNSLNKYRLSYVLRTFNEVMSNLKNKKLYYTFLCKICYVVFFLVFLLIFFSSFLKCNLFSKSWTSCSGSAIFLKIDDTWMLAISKILNN